MFHSFSVSLLMYVATCLLAWTIPGGCGVLLPCAFDLHLHRGRPYVWATSIASLGKSLLKSLVIQNFSWLFVFLVLDVKGS